MYGDCLHACMYVHPVCVGAHRDQKRELDALEHELKVVVSHVSRYWELCKSSKFS